MALKLLGLGNALVDVFSPVEDDFPASLGLHPGSSAHCPYERLEPVILSLPEPAFGSGGGAASMAKLASRLGVEAAFAGAVADDDFGRLFRRDMAEAGVRFDLPNYPGSTGAGVVMRCRSGLRTLLYSPAAATRLQARDLSDELFAWADWVYVEGFLLSRPEFLIAVLNRAALAGTAIAFDLGSWRAVQERRDLALEIVAGYATLTFANEDEFCALAKASLEEALEFFRPERRDIVVKRGAEGAVLLRGEETLRSPARRVEPVDETCAGDAFAAGYLAGLSRGCDAQACLDLGNRVAGLCLSYPGSSVDPERLRAL